MDDTFTTFMFMYAAYTVAQAMVMKKRKRPSFRTNPYLKDRKVKGRFHKDFVDMKNFPKSFTENFHMDVDTYNSVLERVRPHLLPKCNSRPRDFISPEEKFAVVLEYFASGSLQRHMASIYRISKQHLGTIIDDVCEAICKAFDSAIEPLSTEKLMKTANKYNEKWQFPHCVGAIDGKHVAIKAPKNAGSLFYNYKGFHSLVLLAVADADYKFTYANIGAFGSESDANIFSTSDFGRKVINDNLPFPPDASICGANLPFFFIADDAFPLCKRIIKPYGGRQQLNEQETVFNYRLSRARRCVENAFGILTSRWHVLKRTMLCSPDRAKRIISACCILHNYLLEANRNVYCPQNFGDYVDAAGNVVNGKWRNKLSSNTMYGNFLRPHRGRHYDAGKEVRDALKKFVNSPVGSVPWQRQAAFVK